MASTDSANPAEGHPAQAEIEALKTSYPDSVKVIPNVGDCVYVVDVKRPDIDIVIKFQIEAEYPKSAPSIIIKSQKRSSEEQASLTSHLLSECATLNDQPMLEELIQKAQAWLQEHGISNTPEVVEVGTKKSSPKSPRQSKGGRKKKEKARERKVGDDKLPSMKTAEDVISRIFWDDQLDKDYFTVGYLDRFIGVVEKSFNSFSWEDIASVDYNTLAIPKHRIQYFKYKEVKVWDKNERLDNMFGSTGSGMTITDVISQYMPPPEAEEATPNDDDDDEDDIVIRTGHEGGEADDDGLTPRERYWGKKARPTHFLALRITNPAVRASVAEVHRDILEMEPSYAESLIPPEKLHITLCCLGLDTEDQVLDAAKKLEHLKEKFDTWKPQQIEIQLEDVGHFYHNCLYAKVKPHWKFTAFVDFLRKEVKDIGLECRDVFDFVPHMTVLKLKRQEFQENRTRYFDARMYTSYADWKFGQQTFDNIHLCSMSDRQDDGFYQCATLLAFP